VDSSIIDVLDVAPRPQYRETYAASSSLGLYGTCRLRWGLELLRREVFGADDQFFRSESRKYKFGRKQHAELDCPGSHRRRHLPRNLHIRGSQRFHERESHRYDHLHANGHQQFGLDYVDGYRHGYGKLRQASNQFFCRESCQH
jgi:hypothetical protein